MPYKEMNLPKEYGAGCTPVVNHDGTVVRPDYVKFAEYYCSKCGYVQAPAHAVTENFLDQMVNAWDQTGPCPECGAENAWAWRRVDKLSETPVEISDNLTGDRSHSDGSGAGAGGADLTRA